MLEGKEEGRNNCSITELSSTSRSQSGRRGNSIPGERFEVGWNIGLPNSWNLGFFSHHFHCLRHNTVQNSTTWQLKVDPCGWNMVGDGDGGGK